MFLLIFVSHSSDFLLFVCFYFVHQPGVDLHQERQKVCSSVLIRTQWAAGSRLLLLTHVVLFVGSREPR